MNRLEDKTIPKEIELLVKKLNEATEAYDAGHPFISDKMWDDMYFALYDWEQVNRIKVPNSPTENIHFKVVSKLNKKEHEVPMLSLDKTKDSSKYIKYFEDKKYVNMLKLDGLTCALTYENGYLISAETRGNGLVGEDIFHNALVIRSIPKQIETKEELLIFGEIICTKDNFEPFAQEYSNPRNFAAGSIRLLDSKECSRRNLSFYAWEVKKGFNDINSFEERLKALRLQGFRIVPYVSGDNISFNDFLDVAKKCSENIPIDGIVGRFDDIEYGESLGSTGHHSRAAYAFKFYDEEYETELLDIEWTMGRTGQITPIAIFKTLDIDGSNISRASLSNLSIMEETLGKKPFIGQTIYVSKRNMIIPKIEKAKDEYGKWI